MRSVSEQLQAATAQAASAGVRDVPAVLAAGRMFHGERALPDAVAALRAAGTPSEDGDAGLEIHHSR